MTNLKQKRFVDTDYLKEQLDSTSVEVEGSHISATETKIGAIQDLEILGNTVQDPNNLADIKSVGELQEDGTYKMSISSCGKNVWNVPISLFNNDKYIQTSNYLKNSGISLPQNSSWTLTFEKKPNDARLYIWKGDVLSRTIGLGSTGLNQTFTLVDNEDGISFYAGNFGSSPYDIMTVDFKIQLEEGTQATSYEPYQGNKCDILLPCQLEKVGNVSDRLYYDDVEKAWCVEKNVKTIKLNGTEQGWYLGEGGRFFEVPINDIQIPNKPIICDKYKHMVASTGVETGKITTVQHKAIRIHPSDMTGLTLEVFKKQLSQDNVLVKYPTTEPQKIILPLSTQIQLNSFFGTTHIYMESGEVEGTIKCKIAKSVGGTLESLVEKSKMTDTRLEILENVSEGQNMKYSTDKGIIHCTNTKKGRVKDLAIEGNTMVNYCRDGSKTLTLNGDINEVGTHITTTNAVNSGKVDVICEGNTLVNLKLNSSTNCNVSCSGDKSTYVNITESTPTCLKGEILRTGQENGNTWQYYVLGKIQMRPLKTNTVYTLVLKDTYKSTSKFYIQNGDATHCFTNSSSVTSTFKGDLNYIVMTTKDSFEGLNPNYPILYGNLAGAYKGKLDIEVIGFFEGDYTNQPIPTKYVEGMKSVGELEDNVLEVKAENKNLLGIIKDNNQSSWGVSLSYSQGVATLNGTLSSEKDNGLMDFYIVGGWETIIDNLKLKPNTGYTFSGNIPNGVEVYLIYNTRVVAQINNQYKVSSFTNSSHGKIGAIMVRVNQGHTFSNTIINLQLEEGSVATSTVKPNSNKLQIQLSEPLRGLPNGVKDRIVKMNNKWYIERNCVGYTPDTSTATFRKNYNVTSIIDFKIDNIKNYNQSAQSFHMECLSTIPYGDPTGTNWQNETHWLKYYPMTKNTISTEGQRDKGSISIFYNKEWTDQQIIDWCNNNNLKFILPCEIPTYEEITDVELMTYLDTTHISNNSVIPCNMTVKNSGYSTIIKPSTLYTIALDTNKSGEMKVNLGGAEKTTTNNIVTITTPSTLVDDSLRISGKGLTSKNVRIFEGNKTNYIPPYFERLKSSFDEKIEDNHIVEVVSENGDKSNKIQFSTLAPLRSVGDVSDKLVYKDNKWMIERNCGEIVLGDIERKYWTEGTTSGGWTVFNDSIVIYTSDNYIDLKPSIPYICNNLAYIGGSAVCNINTKGTSNQTWNGIGHISVRLPYVELTSNNVEGALEWLKANSTTVIYQLATPYYEEIGEYKNLDSYDEGTTIYANTFIAPKSLSFNLASHMSNIVKDVQDDVSDLKTWRSEVFDSITHKKTFDSGFTTIEDTKEGVIDEFKLEGKTLVNLLKNSSWQTRDPEYIYTHDVVYNPIGKIVTLFNLSDKKIEFAMNKDSNLGQAGAYYGSIYLDAFSKQVISIPDGHGLRSVVGKYVHGWSSDDVDTVKNKILLVEGDCSNLNVSYFEGLKSVGQGTDEIVVSSCNKNLFDIDNFSIGTGSLYAYCKYPITNGLTLSIEDRDTSVNTSEMYIGVTKIGVDASQGNYWCLSNQTIENRVIQTDFSYVSFYPNNRETIEALNKRFKISVYLGKINKPHIPHQSDKKRLLFYNNETQTWEKPILREWDSIEKHLDGKYYYHQRSGEIVLNGSEDWIPVGSSDEDTLLFYIEFNAKPCGLYSARKCISDKIKSSDIDLGSKNIEGIYTAHDGNICIRILKSKLPTQDTQGFKQWLQANNVTAVYQAEEKVYECTNIELNSYNGETNVIVDSGVISPITTVSLTSNLPQVAENLKNRVRQLESELYNYKVNQNLRQLRTSYRSDYANFGVATLNNYSIEPTSIAITPYGYDLFEIFKEVIAQGKDKYDRIELEEYIDFYLMTFVFNFDMVFELFDLLDANEDIIEDEPVEEEPPTEEEEDVVEDTPTILPNLPEDEATPIPLI